MTTINTIKVGKMPGRLVDVAVDGNTTVAQALEFANLEVGEFEVKIDGTTVTNLDQVVPSGTVNILLTAKVKGNSSVVKVGKMPGRLVDVAYDNTTTVAQALEYANLEVGEFEVKIDGATITDLNTIVPEGAVNILLTAKVKGNIIKL